MLFVVVATINYYRRFIVYVIKEVEEIENRVREKIEYTSSDKINEELIPWIFDKVFSRGGDTKYLKMVDLYWHINSFITLTVEVKGTQYIEIPYNLDQLNYKYKHLINAI